MSNDNQGYANVGHDESPALQSLSLRTKKIPILQLLYLTSSDSFEKSINNLLT